MNKSSHFKIKPLIIALLMIALFWLFVTSANGVLIPISFLFFIGYGILLAYKQKYINPTLWLIAALMTSSLFASLTDYYVEEVSLPSEFVAIELLVAFLFLIGPAVISKKASPTLRIALFVIALFPLLAYGLLINPYTYVDQNMAILGYYLLISVGISLVLIKNRKAK